MTVQQPDASYIERLRSEFDDIQTAALKHLQSLGHTAQEKRDHFTEHREFKGYWTFSTQEERNMAEILRKKVVDFGGRLLEAAKLSPLLRSSDRDILRQRLREISSSFFLRRYTYRPPEEIEDHGKVYGMRPAEHREEETDPGAALDYFKRASFSITDKMALIAPSPDQLAGAIVSSQMPGIVQARPNTAFIIMQINEDIAKLEDIKNAIKAGFAEFGVQAVRADEIEHSGVITERILNEIATAEFLIADLTGERPSVYYEVGYAHALGKRPILYREKGAPLHFDLRVHNVPEYKNISDLSKMLRERLRAHTGREPRI
jgi:hypothetical protein